MNKRKINNNKKTQKKYCCNYSERTVKNTRCTLPKHCACIGTFIIKSSRYHINFPIMWILNERTILIDVKTERLQQKYKGSPLLNISKIIEIQYKNRNNFKSKEHMRINWHVHASRRKIRGKGGLFLPFKKNHTLAGDAQNFA